MEHTGSFDEDIILPELKRILQQTGKIPVSMCPGLGLALLTRSSLLQGGTYNSKVSRKKIILLTDISNHSISLSDLKAKRACEGREY